MPTIATTTNADPAIWPNHTLVERDTVDGTMYAIVKATTANTYSLYRSTNGGTTWAVFGSFTRANVVELGSLFITSTQWVYLAYRVNESSEDRIYVRRILPYWTAGGGWEADNLVTAAANGGSAGAVYQGVDVVSYSVGSDHWTAVAVGVTVGANHGVSLFGMFSSYGVGPQPTNLFTGTSRWLVTGSGRVGPSLSLEHTGNGVSSSNPHLWVAFGRTQVRIVKATWNGGGWAGPSASVTLLNPVGARDYIPAKWDGTRWVVAVPNPTQTDTVSVYERNQANTVTTGRITPVHPTGVIRQATVSFNAVNGDIRVFAVGTSTAVLYYVDFVRATGTWTSWATVLATALIGTVAGTNFGTRRGSYGTARHDVYTVHATPTPNTFLLTQQSLTYAPQAPTWNLTGQPYSNGGAADVAVALNVDWDFHDPDPADAQTAFALSRQIGAGALAYLRISDSTWQAAEVKNVTATTLRALAAGWGAGTDSPHTYRVKTWDATDVASAYGDTLTIIPSIKVNPVIVTPAAAAVITTDTVTVTWTAAEESAYRLTLTTNPGGEVRYDSGWVTSTVLTLTPALSLPDLSGWTIGLTTRNLEGLASDTITRNFTVDYVEPAIPTLTFNPSVTEGVIWVTITNPAPSGGQPAVATQELFRRAVGDLTDGLRVATALASGAVVRVWTVVSGVNYEFRALVRGVNGTSIYSPWTS